ncbi:PIN domain-containing protein [Polymorphospora rubra]|uniref:PIN domain-containing protein n=1 Tax=Polymorphospora rubra TaxID=338584 RepID=A0A810MV90_9ACTN|nr:PIN domain-containing protein [Polymorphospora rubra]BCJ65106.1 hypothetical protein Prubr_21270 [Polymorphospora rubra]
MTDRHNAPVRLILDRTALLAYADGNIHVAEVLHEVVGDRGVRFGVPTVVLAETMAVLDDGHDRSAVRDLVELDACAVLPAAAGEWMELAYWLRRLGRIDTAAAALAALVYAAPILTGDGKAYRDEIPVIDFLA